jgi:beta-lactamase regulating signal transducer with metallopeptidase domain
MQTFQKKTNIIFYEITAIIAVFAIVFFYSATSLYSQITLILLAASDKLESICGCANHFSFYNHPYLFTAIFILGFALILYFSCIMFKFIKLRKSTNKYIKENLKKRNCNVSQKLKYAIQQAELENKVIEIKTKKPVVFCFSFFNPKICISSRLVQKLDERELLAVLLHEKMHIKNMEPIKMFLVKSAEKILFFLPGLKSLAKQYFIYAEMAADELATFGFKNKTPLAGALCKVMDLEKKSALGKKQLAVSFFNITDERINKLIDNDYKPKYRLNSAKLAIDFLILILMAFSFFQIKNYDLALAENHHYDSCSHQQDMQKESCEIFQVKSTCQMEEEPAVINYFDKCYNEDQKASGFSL